MGFLQEQVSEINGIQLHTVSSNAFKTNSLILRLKAPLSEKDVTIRALLPMFCKEVQHPTHPQLN